MLVCHQYTTHKLDTMFMMKQPELGKRLFSYAVIADTHINHGEKTTNSVYPVNALHNARLRFVVRDINAQPDLQFVMHLGDMVHPVPAIPDKFAQAAERFRELTAELTLPIHLVPGNHDVGDKPSEWTPAICIEEDFVALYRSEFGDDYYAFDHQNVHFVVLNVQLCNSGLAGEQQQRAWLEQYLEKHAGQRFIFNIHYPVFLAKREEDPHYDNLDEPARTWLLELLEQHQVEALFAGHVHNFWYQRYAHTDCYYLPSTAMIRQDYSELVRTPPHAGMEGGRNDQPKHGYFLMHVHESGHTVEIVRTYGQVAEPDAPLPKSVIKVRPVHPLQNSRASLGFDMRQDWMELVHIPPSGGPDEFNRKLARNDYPLMALWEMGVRRLRIPKLDIQDPSRRERLRALLRHGHEFVLYSFGVPDPRTIELIKTNPDLLAAIEIVLPWQSLSKTVEELAVLQQTNIPVYLSKLRGKDDHDDSTGKFVHAINHGFLPSEEEQIKLLTHLDCVHGAVFRLASTESVSDNVLAVGTLCEEANISGSIIMRMSTASPEGFRKDELWSANRIAESVLVSATQTNLHVMCDTFADFDRGFFRRFGVVDRLYNPRLGFHVLRHLYGALHIYPDSLQLAEIRTTTNSRSVHVRHGSGALILLMPTAGNDSYLSRDEVASYFVNDPICLDLANGHYVESCPERLTTPVLLSTPRN